MIKNAFEDMSPPTGWRRETIVRNRWICGLAMGLLAVGLGTILQILPLRAAEDQKWLSLFDGKSLTGWKVTQFGGQGEVVVEDGKMILEMGSPMSGVTYTGEFPKQDFEISLEAMRMEGTDFFCGLTFPVRDSHASLIVGGWAGSVVGISSIDGQDAANNDTTQVIGFKSNQWYKIRVRVTADLIRAWIDDKMVVDQNIQGKKISTRIEVDLSKPLGISTYETKAAIRNMQYRKL